MEQHEDPEFHELPLSTCSSSPADFDRLKDLDMIGSWENRISSRLMIITPLQNHDFSKIAKLVKNCTKK